MKSIYNDDGNCSITSNAQSTTTQRVDFLCFKLYNLVKGGDENCPSGNEFECAARSQSVEKRMTMAAKPTSETKMLWTHRRLLQRCIFPLCGNSGRRGGQLDIRQVENPTSLWLMLKATFSRTLSPSGQAKIDAENRPLKPTNWFDNRWG